MGTKWTRFIMKASENQVGGTHYSSMAIQPYEYCQKNKLGYMESRAITYLSRWESKGGKEDLLKAIHCIELRIQMLEEESLPTLPSGRTLVNVTKRG